MQLWYNTASIHSPLALAAGSPQNRFLSNPSRVITTLFSRLLPPAYLSDLTQYYILRLTDPPSLTTAAYVDNGTKRQPSNKLQLAKETALIAFMGKCCWFSLCHDDIWIVSSRRTIAQSDTRSTRGILGTSSVTMIQSLGRYACSPPTAFPLSGFGMRRRSYGLSRWCSPKRFRYIAFNGDQIHPVVATLGVEVKGLVMDANKVMVRLHAKLR